MLFYFLLFSISLFFVFLSIYDSRNKSIGSKPKLFLFMMSGLVVAAAFGIREGFGTDYYSVYVQGYNEIAAGQQSRFEIGFVALCKGLSYLGFDYHALFFVTSVLIVFLVYSSIYRQTDEAIWGVFIFEFGGLLLFSSNGVRQAIAAGFILNALPFASRSEWRKYFAIVGFAALFHSTALIFLPFYFLKDWRPDSWKSVVLFALAIFLGGYLSSALLGFAAAVSPQVARYVSAEHLSNQYLAKGNIDLADLIICSMTLFLYVSVKHGSSEPPDRHTSFLFVLIMVGVIVCFLSKYVMIFSRLAVYFTAICVTAIPRLFRFGDVSGVKLISYYKTLYFCFVITIFIYLYGHLNFSQVIPYTSFLN